jgi:hypothetical protein
MEVCINLEFGDGNFENGFDEHKFCVTFFTQEQQIARFSAQLKPNTNIPISYDLWKQKYYFLLDNHPQRRGFIDNQTTHISEKCCRKEVKNLHQQMQQWLQPLQSKVSSVLRDYPDAEVRLIIHTNKVKSLVTKDTLHRLPWHEWNFCTEDLPAQNYTKEAALCFNSQTVKAPVSEDVSANDKKIRRVRIISVFVTVRVLISTLTRSYYKN